MHKLRFSTQCRANTVLPAGHSFSFNSCVAAVDVYCFNTTVAALPMPEFMTNHCATRHTHVRCGLPVGHAPFASFSSSKRDGTTMLVIRSNNFSPVLVFKKNVACVLQGINFCSLTGGITAMPMLQRTCRQCLLGLVLAHQASIFCNKTLQSSEMLSCRISLFQRK